LASLAGKIGAAKSSIEGSNVSISLLELGVFDARNA